MIRKDNIVKIIIAVVLILGAIALLVNNRINYNQDNNNDENSIYNNNLNAEYTQNVDNIVNPYVEKLEDGQIENNSPELKKEKQFKKIEITNINFVYNPGNKMTTITADLLNSGTEEQEQEVVNLRILDQNKNEIVTIEALIPRIRQGKTKTLRCSATADLSNARDFEIIEK